MEKINDMNSVKTHHFGGIFAPKWMDMVWNDDFLIENTLR